MEAVRVTLEKKEVAGMRNPCFGCTEEERRKKKEERRKGLGMKGKSRVAPLNLPMHPCVCFLHTTTCVFYCYFMSILLFFLHSPCY